MHQFFVDADSLISVICQLLLIWHLTTKNKNR
jgi:hypothetical protein